MDEYVRVLQEMDRYTAIRRYMNELGADAHKMQEVLSSAGEYDLSGFTLPYGCKTVAEWKKEQKKIDAQIKMKRQKVKLRDSEALAAYLIIVGYSEIISYFKTNKAALSKFENEHAELKKYEERPLAFADEDAVDEAVKLLKNGNSVEHVAAYFRAPVVTTEAVLQKAMGKRAYNKELKKQKNETVDIKARFQSRDDMQTALEMHEIGWTPMHISEWFWVDERVVAELLEHGMPEEKAESKG